MSDDDDNDLSYSAQHISELLRCPICLDRFKNPKLLPCQHTFCERPCLEGLVDRFHQIRCPECRVQHRVPYAGVSSFPVNRTLRNFLDLPTQRLPRTTSTDDSVNNANSNNSPRERAAAQNANGSPAAPPATQRSTGCVSCGREQALSRCSHCETIVCDVCKRSHIDQLKLDINRLVGQLRRGIPSLSDAVSTIEGKSEQLHQRAESAKQDISEMIERYISEIRTRQRLLHSEVQMWLMGELRSLRLCQENVEVELASTASFCDSTEAMLARSNHSAPDEDLVEIRRQCVEHMENIRAYENGTGVRLPRERQMQILFEGNRFSQTISNFGELVLSDNGSSNTGSSGPASGSQSHSGSSSRETSPAVTGATGVSSLAVRDRSVSRSPVTTDRALSLIGSSHASSPRLTHRTVERAAGYLGGSGSNASAATSQSSRRPERSPGLMGIAGGGGAPASPQPERAAGLIAAGAVGGGAPAAGAGRGRGANARGQATPPSLSWELPLDFTYPRRNESRAGNSTSESRRRMAEQRRRNLSDTRIAGLLGGGGIGDNVSRSLPSQSTSGDSPATSQAPVASTSQTGASRNGSQSTTGGITSRNQSTAGSTTSRNQSTTGSTTSRNQSTTGSTTSRNQSTTGSTTSRNPSTSTDRPPLVRSRTYTREDMQPIREEESQSRASTADPVNRPRTPIRFDVSLSRGNTSTEASHFNVGNIGGGESVRVNVARNNYQDKGRSIIRFGSRGSGDSQFVWPRGVAISRADHIYVADSSNHRIQVYDSIGSYIKTVGSYGQGDGEFDCVTGITINSMGELIITDRYNHRIQLFDHQGNFKVTFGEEGQGDGQLLYPWGVACDNMGFIYVCDKENHRIQVFQSTGHFVRKFGGRGHQIGHFENPHYLAVSPDNRVYVSDSSNHRIQVFSIYGDFIFTFGSQGTMQGQMKYPKGIAIDDQGFVAVADSGNNRIQVFRGDGRFYGMFGAYGSENGQFKGLEGLAILGNGNVVVSDRENHRIQIF